MKIKIKLLMLLLIIFPFFTSCGGNNKVIYKESNENAALSVLHYVKNTTCLENIGQMEDKDMLSFKMVSGNSTVVENNGDGKVYMSYSYTIKGSKVEKSKSFDVKNYGVVSIRGTEATVVSNPTDEDVCPNFKPSEPRYVDVKLVNQMFKMYNEAGKENITDGKNPNDQNKSSSNNIVKPNSVTPSNTTSSSASNEREAEILSVDGATIDKYKKEINMVVSNDIMSVNLRDKVSCSPNSTWRLYHDEFGQSEIITKIVAGKDGYLKEGENIFYIIVSSLDGNKINVYTLKVYKSFTITINYLFNDEILNTENAPTGYEKELRYIPTIAEHKFNYWMDNNNRRVDKITPFKNVTLYANVTANKYTITLNPDGGSVSYNTKIVEYGSDYVLPVPTKTGFTFGGWYNGDTQLTNGNGESLSKWTISNNITVDARWTTNQYRLSLMNSNSDAGTLTGSGKYSYDSIVTVRALPNDGCTFKGWYNSSDVCVSTESVYTFKMGASDETLTAEWNYKNITLNYIVNGIVVHTETYTLEKHIDVSYQYETMEEFYGWYSTSSFSSDTKNVSSTKGLTIINNNAYLYGGTINPRGLLFQYKNDGYTITGYVGHETNLEIPSTINGISVKSISSEAFKGCSSLTSIVIPNSVTSIGKDTFKGCNSLESLTLPFLNTYLGYYFGASSFQYNSNYVASSLKEIIITGGTSIEGKAFYECSSLTSIVIPNNITRIEAWTFSGCSSLTSIEIPNSVTYIGYNAFSNCSSLTSIEIPNSVTSIGEDAFHHCSSLTSIEIPNSVTSIGIYAFYYCSSLTSIEIPNSVTSIGKYAFSHCSSLTSIVIPDSVTSIESYAFYYCSSLTSIEIPNSVTSIEEGAFSNCSSLTSIIIPNSVTDIKSSAFTGCDSLVIYCEASSKPSGWNENWNMCYITSYIPVEFGINENNFLVKDGLIYIIKNEEAVVSGHEANITNAVIPETIEVNGTTYSVTSIGARAFAGCTSLTAIDIPNSVTTIENDVFSGFNSSQCIEYGNCLYLGNEKNPYLVLVKAKNKDIIEARIHEKTRFIMDYAFHDCSSLTSIVIPNSVKNIVEYAFRGCSSLTIYCEASSKPSGWNYYWNDSDRPVYWGVTQEDIIYHQDGLQYLIKNGEAVVSGHEANITNIVIPETIEVNGTTYSVTSIGNGAFYECRSLNSIVIPSSVTSIGWGAFSHCSSLTSIVIPNSVTSIEGEAFSYCTKLISVTFEERSKLASIGWGAFYYCSSLTSIVIPSWVQSIGGYAFAYCSSLTIYCMASSKPNGWNKWNPSNRPVVWGYNQ